MATDGSTSLARTIQRPTTRLPALTTGASSTVPPVPPQVRLSGPPQFKRLGPVGESEWDIESLDIVDLNADGECRHQLRRLRVQRLALFCALSFVPCFACLLARVLALHDIALLYGSDVRVCVRAQVTSTWSFRERPAHPGDAWPLGVSGL